MAQEAIVLSADERKLLEDAVRRHISELRHEAHFIHEDDVAECEAYIAQLEALSLKLKPQD